MKFVKIFLFVVFPLFLMLGGAYGLAKIGVIPIRKMTAKNKLAKQIVKLIGLDSPRLPAVHSNVKPLQSPAQPDAEKRAIADEKAAFEKQRSDWEAAHQPPATSASKPAGAHDSMDPAAITRLASIYEQMPADAANKILAKLPEAEVT